MAAETSAAHTADRGATPATAPYNNPAPLDPTIEALLEQQANIHAKLAVLLPQKYGPNVRVELEHLRHKLRVMRAFADSHRFLDRIPILSEMEEARQLQYQIECIETACLNHGHDLHDPRVIDALESAHLHDVPAGFGDWLRRNFANCDVAMRAWKIRGGSLADPGNAAFHSYKCPDENCLHYIYGFLHREDRDLHTRAHSTQAKRDSGLSMGGTPPPSLPPSSLARSQQLSSSSFLGYPSPTHPVGGGGGGSLQLPPPPMARGSETKEHRGTLRGYSLISDYSSSHPTRDSVDPEVDPLLPPLKRSRMGPSRLESIGELRLLQGAEPCLRCKILKQPCDANDPCSSCYPSPEDPAQGSDFWRLLGCYRAPLDSLVNILVPAFLSPGRADTPATSPLAQRRSINDRLERTHRASPDAAKVVQTNLDFDDDFWWTEDLAIMSSAAQNRASSFSQERAQRPPPVLAALACSWGMSGTAYNFWQLLKLSGLLSVTRHAEAASFPVLHQAKLLLREVLFFDLQQARSSLLPEGVHSAEQPSVADDYECHIRHRAVRGCVAQFLQSFENATAQREVVDPRQWLSLFFSLCICSITRTILADMASLPQRRESATSTTCPPGTQTSPAASIHAIYKAMVEMFVSGLPVILDDPTTAMADDDRELYNTASMIIKYHAWHIWKLSSTRDFLLLLGSAELPGGVWHGFLRQRSAGGPGRLLLSEQPALQLQTQAQVQVQAQAQTQQAPTSIMRPPQAADQWTTTPILPSAGAALVASPQSIGSDSNGGREHAMGIGSPSYARSNGHSFTSPTPKMRPAYPRQSLGRVFCTKCSEYPEGFRGEHELRRHVDAKHAALVKRWICVEPMGQLSPNSPRPAVPLTKCKACLAKKRYGAYYNAAAHLRRAHFNPYKGTKISGEWPPMTVLKDWMQEVVQSFDSPEDPMSSDGDEYGDYKTREYMEPPRSRHSPSSETPRYTAAPTRDRPSPAAQLMHIQPSLQPLLGPTMAAPNAVSGSGSTAMHMAPMHVPPLQIPPIHGKQPQQQQQQPLPPPPQHRRSMGTPMAGELPPASGSHHHGHQSSPGQKAVPTAAAAAAAASVKPEEGHPPNRNRCPHPECGRVFKDLNAHMLTHMEERPEKCPIETCEYHTKGFARKYDKNRHALTHYKGTMVCPFCHGVYEKAFNRADVFKRHLTAVHNVEQTPPNSRKMALGSGAARHGSNATEGPDGRAPAKCSICQSQFLTAQEFYEHLDDCVLNVIVPSTPRSAGAVSTAGTITSSSSGSTAASSAVSSAGTGSTATAGGPGGSGEEATPTMSTTANTERSDRPAEAQPEGAIKTEPPLRHLLPGLPSEQDSSYGRGRRPERRYEAVHGERRDGYFAGGGPRPPTVENGTRR